MQEKGDVEAVANIADRTNRFIQLDLQLRQVESQREPFQFCTVRSVPGRVIPQQSYIKMNAPRLVYKSVHSSLSSTNATPDCGMRPWGSLSLTIRGRPQFLMKRLRETWKLLVS